MSAIVRNLVLEQGTTFNYVINANTASYSNINLTGYSGESEFRRWFTSINVYSFDVVINASAGTISLQMNANNTTNVYPGQYLYDIKLTDPNGNVYRFMEGLLFVSPEISQ
jgi:hypothetical protein